MNQTLHSVLLAAHKNSKPHGLLLQTTPYLVDSILELLFPIRAQNITSSPEAIEQSLLNIKASLAKILSFIPEVSSSTDILSQSFLDSLAKIQQLLHHDAEAMHRGDPAANSSDEVILCYPGFLALAAYRIAHQLYRQGIPLLPRVITEYAHRKTGIDIHPGAIIGASCCIDHGTGIVIGETSVIGNDVRLYQGVTLGGLTVSKELANKKRHPTIGNNVTIYANATILGGNTTIGDNCVIGGSVWLTTSVPANSTVYHRSEVTRTINDPSISKS